MSISEICILAFHLKAYYPLDKIIDLFFNGLSIAAIIIGVYLLVSGLNLKYVKTYYLKAWLVVIIIQISFYLVNINNILPYNITLNYFGFPLSLLHMPLFYLAVVDLTRIKKIKTLEVILHCFPYILIVLLLIYLDISSENDVIVVNGFIGIPTDQPYFIRAYIGIPLALSGFIYALACLIVMQIYKKQLKNKLSNTDAYQLHWISYLVWTIIILFILIYSVISASSDFSLIESSQTFKLVNIFLFFFLLFFGVKYQQQLIYFIKNNIKPLTTDTKLKYSHSALQLEDMKVISEKLNNLMITESIYLDEYLSLQQVSELLNETTQNISQTLNTFLETNFYNYVNAFRLELAEKKLIDSQYSKLSIIGIAMDCGFKSKSTFYKLFKQKTGKTPSEYRNLE